MTREAPGGGDRDQGSGWSDGSDERDADGDQEAVGPSTVPGFSAGAALVALLAACVLLARTRR